MIDTLLFDLDGTLLDTLTDLRLSVNHALLTMGFPERSHEDIRAFVGNGAEKLIIRSAPEGSDEQTVKTLLALFNAHYQLHSVDHTAPYEGIPDLLENLNQAGFSMAVVSNKPAYATEALCRRFFGEQIHVSVGQRADLPKKPEPHMIKEAMRLLQKEKERCLYVGDSEVDVETARRAGIPFLAVDWGFRSHAQLRAAGAERIFSDPESLFHHILHLRGERTI